MRVLLVCNACQASLSADDGSPEEQAFAAQHGDCGTEDYWEDM